MPQRLHPSSRPSPAHEAAASQQALAARLLERDQQLGRLAHELAVLQAGRGRPAGPADVLLAMAADDLEAALALVAVQTRKREAAEHEAQASAREAAHLREEVVRLGLLVDRLHRERRPDAARRQVSGRGGA